MVLWVSGLLPVLLEELDQIHWKIGGATLSLRTVIEDGASTGRLRAARVRWIATAGDPDGDDEDHLDPGVLHGPDQALRARDLLGAGAHLFLTPLQSRDHGGAWSLSTRNPPTRMGSEGARGRHWRQMSGYPARLPTTMTICFTKAS